jgi:hypothetical protein
LLYKKSLVELLYGKAVIEDGMVSSRGEDAA